MKVIIGLGNPGDEYHQTRHNIGFYIVDRLARKHAINWQLKTKLHAQVAQVKIGNETVLLVKPVTFYNESGQAVRAVRNFYKLDNTDMLVIHDELMLPFGVIRTRTNGSDAGNNGIKNLIAHIGDTFDRVRIGVWHESRETKADTDFVLGTFNQTEAKALPEIQKIVEKIITGFVKNDFKTTSYKLSGLAATDLPPGV